MVHVKIDTVQLKKKKKKQKNVCAVILFQTVENAILQLIRIKQYPIWKSWESWKSALVEID